MRTILKEFCLLFGLAFFFTVFAFAYFVDVRTIKNVDAEDLKTRLPSREVTIEAKLLNLEDRMTVVEEKLKASVPQSTKSGPAKKTAPTDLEVTRLFCAACHSTSSSAEKGGDLTIFDDTGKPTLDTQVVELSIRKVENKTMPHRRSRVQPTDAQRKQILNWLASVKGKQ